MSDTEHRAKVEWARDLIARQEAYFAKTPAHHRRIRQQALEGLHAFADAPRYRAMSEALLTELLEDPSIYIRGRAIKELKRRDEEREETT